jgi:ABC-type lipoprotein export system ATPase subunit
MLRLKSISKKYGAQQILNSVNFAVGQKEFISIIGKSGVGKTTLLSILSGLVRPDKGEIFFNDENIGNFDEEQLARFRLMNIGIIFQDFKIILSLSVYDNVYLALHPRKDIEKSKRKKMVEEMVALVGLEDKLNQLVDNLSGGEKQRVAIARSLVGMPKLVFADEPTGNLDEKTSKEIIKLFEKLHNELDTTFIVITHDKEIANKAQKTYQLINHKLKII